MMDEKEVLAWIQRRIEAWPNDEYDVWGVERGMARRIALTGAVDRPSIGAIVGFHEGFG